MSDPVIIPRESYAFMVWRKNNRIPRFRHETLPQAMTEAQHLAAANPGSAFVVMQELARITVPKPSATPQPMAEPDELHAPRGSSGSPGDAG